MDLFWRLDVRELARAPGFPRGGWPEARAEWSRWSLAPDAPGLIVEALAVEGAEGVTGLLISHDGLSYGVVLEFEPCNLGGARPWFRCPESDCDRRCAVLYLCGSGYACRKCLQLRYPSQREDAFARACRRRDRILMRLGCETGPALSASKPRRMWQRTFDRLWARARQADGEALALMSRAASADELQIKTLEAEIDASVAKGPTSRSTGPRTPEGKARVAEAARRTMLERWKRKKASAAGVP